VATYKLTADPGTVIRTADDARVPTDGTSADSRLYLDWLAAPNTPDPADPPPVVFAASEQLTRSARTTDNTPTELLRATLPTRSGYAIMIEVIGVNAGTGHTRRVLAAVTVGRWDGAAVQGTGSPALLANHPMGASPPAAPTASVSGTDYVITVTGANGQTIDWTLFAEVRRFRPGGF
jgi:hypothetical protein